MLPKGNSFEAIGLLPSSNNTEEPFSIRELVRLTSQKLEIPASECWQMSIPDLFLTIIKPEERMQNASQRILEEIDERIARKDKLTLEQRIALERFIIDNT